MDSDTADVLKQGHIRRPMQRDALKQGQTQSQVFKQGKIQGDVLKQHQMQSGKLTSQFNSPTKSSLAGATKASLLNGQNEKIVVEDAKTSSPRVKRNKTGPNQLSYKESNVSAKHVLSEDIGGTTELKRLLTPINLFEDECIFCHSFRTSQLHGSMVCYLKGRVVSIEEGNSSNAIYVHKKCLEWTPLVWFEGDVVVNLESELRRASRLRCERCGLLGAALGCYDNNCKRSFHIPCALRIDCRWDVDERLVLCPKHVSKTLPCDKLCTHTKEDDNSSSLHQSQCSYKEDSFTDFEEEGQQSDQLKITSPCTDKEGKLDNHHRENQQTDQLNTSNAAAFAQSPYIHKEVIFDNHQRENQQTDQFNILNPSYLSQSQCSLKEGISTNSSRDGNQIDQLDTSSSPSLPLGKHSDEEEICMNCERDDQRAHKRTTSISRCSPKSCHPDEEGISSVYKGEKINAYQPDTSSFPSDQLVLLGLSLSASEKDSLQDFACWTNVRLTKEWGENVTHVIVGKGAGTSWSRSFEALMAILLGKWVVHFEWIADCSLEMTRRPEASYEAALSMDSLGTIDGPKKGRIRATKGAPKLFSGLRFCLSAYMDPDGRHRVRNLIAAAGGQVLREGFLDLLLGYRDGSSVRPYLVFDADTPGEFSRSTLEEEVVEARKHAAAGARVISHLRVLDAVAAYDAEILDR